MKMFYETVIKPRNKKLSDTLGIKKIEVQYEPSTHKKMFTHVYFNPKTGRTRYLVRFWY